MKGFVYIIMILLFVGLVGKSCSPLEKAYKPVQEIKDTLRFTKVDGQLLNLEFYKGRSFNHPSFAVWLEDLEGKFLKSIFVTKSVASGSFRNAQLSDSTWDKKSGKSYRPAALPYWFHKKGKLKTGGLIPTPENQYTDAFTGATPLRDFVLEASAGKQLPQRFKVLMEINQTWDWNEHWTNNKFPTDNDYKSSAQPSLIYAVEIDLNNPKHDYYLNPIGHGHYGGKNGKLFTNLTSLSTALEIAFKVKVSVK